MKISSGMAPAAWPAAKRGGFVWRQLAKIVNRRRRRKRKRSAMALALSQQHGSSKAYRQRRHNGVKAYHQ
jgi:hypothetical protein